MRSYGYINGEYAYILLVDVYIGVYGWLWWINCVQYVNICIYIYLNVYIPIYVVLISYVVHIYIYIPIYWIVMVN